MPEKKPLLIRINPQLWEDLRRLADQELRSLNGQIEYMLAEAVRKRHPREGSGEEPRERV